MEALHQTRILVIDDDLQILELLRVALTRAGFTVEDRIVGIRRDLCCFVFAPFAENLSGRNCSTTNCDRTATIVVMFNTATRP
jgi:hypothetical protein